MARIFQSALQVGGIQTTAILQFRESHQLGVPARATVDVLFEEYKDVEDLVGSPAALQFSYDGHDHVHMFAGVVDSATVLGTSAMGFTGRTYQYSFEIVSAIEFLSRDFGCNTYQDKNVVDVLKAFLKDVGLQSDLFEWKLTGSYKPRAWCVRYQESALAFVTRLCEHEGIYFFCETGDDGKEKIVFADDSTAAKPIAGDEAIVVRTRTGLHDEKDAIYAVRERHRVVSGKFVLRDFDFERPSLDLTQNAASDKHTDLEVYDYPGGYFDVGEGKRLAGVRLDAEQAERHTIEIHTDAHRVAIARKLKIAESAGPADGEYFVTGVVFDFVDKPNQADADSGDSMFQITATLLPIKLKYRLPCITPKPIIAGPQTATVMAPAGSQVEEIHTDKHGRCKVKFHWDQSSDIDDKASAWFRTEQLQTSGSMILPRISWEVIVDFLEGDPDRPIIVGRVYNGMFMPPYKLPEGKTRTAIKTQSTPGGMGGNEIRMEDKAGSEEIMIHAQKDANVATANNKTKTVGNNETSVVKVDSKLEVGGTQEVKITKGSKNEITGNQTVDVGGSRKVEVNAVTGLTVGGNSTNTIGGSQKSMVGNPLEALLALAAAKAAEYAAAKAGDALAHIDGAIQGKVNQVMGPVNSVVGKAQSLGAGMQALGGGDLSAAGGILGAAGALPSAGGLFGGAAAAATPAGGGQSAGEISASNMLGGAVQNAIQRGIGAGAGALGSALGLGGGDGGGQSTANAAGPAGNVDGVDQTDRAKGPGHTLYKITGTHLEDVGSIKALLALNGINTNVSGDKNEKVSIAKIEGVLKDYAESAASKDELNIGGILVYTKGDESEDVSTSRTTMVGGAIVDLIKGGHSVTASAPLTMIGAFHKVEAKTGITLKCGASKVVIDGSGITIESPAITYTAAKIQLPKGVTEI